MFDVEKPQVNIDELWQEYILTHSEESKNTLTLYYIDIVEQVARRMMRMYGQYVEYDDIVGYGMLGLLDAIEKFEPDKQVKFETYSQLRIRGEIIDSIRRMDWAPVSLRSKIKLISLAYDELVSAGVENVTDNDVAKKLKIDVCKVRKIQAASSMFNAMSLEDVLYKAVSSNEQSMEIADLSAKPGAAIERKELLKILAQAISQMSEKEQLVISLYYFEELMIKDIAKILEVSESRTSQIHSKALAMLHNKLVQAYGSEDILD